MMRIPRISTLHDLYAFYYKSFASSILYKEVSMKIYYSKFVGVGYLLFASAVFPQIFFLLMHGSIDFSQLNLLTVIPSVLFFAAIYATIAGIKRLTSHRASFEFTFEGISVYPGLFFSKEIFIPKEELLRASYVEVDVSDPDHPNSKSCYLDFDLREVTQLEDISKSNIVIDTSFRTLRLSLSLCRFREEEKTELATYLKENYGIDFMY